jgi:hypothetical protein
MRLARRRSLAVLVVASLAAGALLSAGSTAAQSTATRPWQGTWKTSWGTLTLVQNGTRITGSYTHDGGKVVGRVVGRTVTGTWTEAPTYKGPKDAGSFTWTLAPSGRSFAGHWRYASSRTWSSAWTGTLVATPTQVSWTGEWSSNWGVVKMTQTGARVTGTYPHDSGKIVATVSGVKLTGTWSEAPTYAGPRDAGPFVFTMSADGMSFTGLWAYAGQTPSSGWSGSRIST